ncbi:uncharacterized protein N0V89_004214 [Didymosphaeria variabile]|uniref:Uncharacterized protein n=1 Tax=Didymosphaeria variabile TaxID=1932322 RepID=A0A9W9CC79_9PLEO|nr:uncharacterized protein N0V89_004214 [Didymosphaeria variabile]KAJ4356184.1 hypothetical protein N0V89_004214 [Didymosphaeria variabile]
MQPVWVGGLLTQYWDELRMMDAAYFGIEHAHWMLSTMIETCQINILTRYDFITNRAQILAFPHVARNLANVILIPIEDWARTVGPRLQEVAHAMESLGAMIIARDAGRGRHVTGTGHPMTLPIRNAPRHTPGQNIQSTHYQAAQASGTQASQPANSQATHILIAVQPSQATLNEINEMIEMLSRQHLTNCKLP